MQTVAQPGGGARKTPNNIPSRQANIQEDTNYRVMRLLEENPDLTQRELAEKQYT